MIKISVIVPIYNVEKYLKKCLDSIIYQSLKDIEIIMVDDGSTDSCSQICDYYSSLDERIKVVHKENQGLGLARNTGLDIAKGKYVTFIDSDDYISIDYLKKVYNVAEENKADVVYSGFANLNNDGIVEFSPNPYGNRKIYKNGIKNIMYEMMGSKHKDKIDQIVLM